jgi:hypothetical protein
MARTHGRAPRGERLRVGVPHGHWKTTIVVAGLTLRGIVAPFVLSGPINRDAFEAYVDRVLVPELRPGDIVVLRVRDQPDDLPLLDRDGLACRPSRICVSSPGAEQPRSVAARSPTATVAAVGEAEGFARGRHLAAVTSAG